MAELTPQQRLEADRMLDSTFHTLQNPGAPSIADMYRGILPTGTPAPAASALTTRPVNTVPINPTTGMPYTSQTPGPALRAPGEGLSLAQMFAMREPGYDATRETIVAGGTRKGVGFEAGNSYGPSYRLLPDVGTPNAALDAATRVADATPLPRRRPVGAPAGAGLADMFDGGGGVLGVGNDPWDGLRMASQQGRTMRLDASAPGGIATSFTPMGGALSLPAAQKPKGLLQTIVDMFSGSASQAPYAPVAAPLISQNPELQSVHDDVMGYDRTTGGWLSLSG